MDIGLHIETKQSYRGITMGIIRVCLTSFGETTLSIGKEALSEDDFQQRIGRASQGQIEVIFLLAGGNNTDKSSDVKIIRLRKLKCLPRWVSYPLIWFKNLPLLLKQDVFVAPGVELDGFIVCLFCKLFRKKSMITIHGHYAEEWKTRHYSKLMLRLARINARFTLKFADMMVTINEKIKQEHIDKGVNPSRLSVRYVFVDTEKFSRKRIDEEEFRQFKSNYGLPDKYILYVGQLNARERGHIDMLEVFKKIHSKLPTYKCVMVGKGPLKAQVDSFIIENSLTNDVIQIEGVDHELMPYLYYGAEILILPIHPPARGVGKIRLEALSMEIPVIVNDIPAGYQVVIDGETGYRIPEGNINLMASKAIYLLKNPDVKKKFGLNGRKLIQAKNDINIYIDNWINSIRSLVQES